MIDSPNAFIVVTEDYGQSSDPHPSTTTNDGSLVATTTVADVYETMEDLIEEFACRYLEQPPVHHLQNDRYRLIDDDQLCAHIIVEIDFGTTIQYSADEELPSLQQTYHPWPEEFSVGCDI